MSLQREPLYSATEKESSQVFPKSTQMISRVLRTAGQHNYNNLPLKQPKNALISHCHFEPLYSGTAVERCVWETSAVTEGVSVIIVSGLEAFPVPSHTQVRGEAAAAVTRLKAKYWESITAERWFLVTSVCVCVWVREREWECKRHFLGIAKF